MVPLNKGAWSSQAVGRPKQGSGMKKKRSFREKLADPKDLPRVQQLTGGMKLRYGPGTIVLPAPSEVEALMRKVPRGRVTTINQLRECLARRHGATGACPIVTGIQTHDILSSNPPSPHSIFTSVVTGRIFKHVDILGVTPRDLLTACSPRDSSSKRQS